MEFSSRKQSCEGYERPQVLLHHDIQRIYRNGLPFTSTVQIHVSKTLRERLFGSICVVFFANEKNCFHLPTQLGTRKIRKKDAMTGDTKNAIAIVAVGPASCTLPCASFFARPPMT